MAYFEAQSGIKWHYDLEGEGDVLIFIHGWGIDRRIWRQQTKHFSTSYKVMAIDLPGHGNSSWKNIHLYHMAKDIIELIDHLQLNQITFIASSLGGLFTLKVFELRPDVFKQIIFVGSMPKFAKSEDYPFGLEISRLQKLESQLDSSYPNIIDIFFRSLFTKEERSSRRFKWLQRFRQNDTAPMKPALVEYLEIIELVDLRNVLTSVTIPVQFINGTEDYICNQEAIAYLQELCPNADFKYFEHCGHFPFLSKPHEFNVMVEEFLNDHQ